MAIVVIRGEKGHQIGANTDRLNIGYFGRAWNDEEDRRFDDLLLEINENRKWKKIVFGWNGEVKANTTGLRIIKDDEVKELVGWGWGYDHIWVVLEPRERKNSKKLIEFIISEMDYYNED